MTSANPASTTVLVVEDDRGVRESLEVVMQVQGYEVVGVERGEHALSAVEQHTPDLIVLDINLPGIDGVETCRRLREARFSGPILMLTARHETADRVVGLDAGADDYLPKPFALDELLARIRALLRAFRPDGAATAVDGRLELGDLWVEPSSRRAGRADSELDLTKIEFDLLELLVKNSGKVLERNEIHIAVWGYDEDTASNTLEVFVSSLRKKIEAGGGPRLIHTKRGVGYVARLAP
ncbi:MAG: response regulator transcription factor [Acidimicrobiales bacterium]